MYREISEKLLDFLAKSPTAFQAVDQMKKRFSEEGFTCLSEKEHWKLERGGKYFVSRNHSAFIAFSIPGEEHNCFRIIASHGDSPCLKIKEQPEIRIENAYVRLNVEKYGGMIDSSWFDRPLSVAGRILSEENGAIKEHLYCSEKDVLMIPGLAIHMNRKMNKGFEYNAQKELLPLFGGSELASEKNCFMEWIAGENGISRDQILSYDLFVYNRQEGRIWGAKEEFVSSPRLDDLQCAFASMEGMLRAKKENAIAVHCVFDNEEVGSTTKQGAASTFLKDTLERIFMALGKSREEYLMALADSFMVSADNAHALHPNYTEKADPVNRPLMNGGIVIKYNASQKYCTDGVSAAMFRTLCKKAGVPCQVFVNRSDIAGGSTLGNIANTQIAMNTVDIGLPQLAMHSAYETCGVKDTAYLIQAAEQLFA